MKLPITIIGLTVLLVSCKNEPAIIVEKRFTDSLLAGFTIPAAVKTTGEEIVFWKNRLDPVSTGISNESRYSAALISRFHQLGDIKDVKMADSLMRLVNAAYQYKEAAPNMALCQYSILQHRFVEADNYLEAARKIGLKPYELLTTSFDVDFELGRFSTAASYMQQLRPYGDYGYYFRRSKMEHLKGQMDSAIQSMLAAADKATGSAYLKNTALSNAADLYIHAGKLADAAALYKECIRGNGADFHSITGLGWIALVHDKKDSTAQQLFEFVQQQTRLPDPLFKLYQVAQQRHDSIASAGYANAFAEKVADTIYGNMYNKYLVELYTGILHQPAKAAALAKRELQNRSTPQTNAWYAWALLSNNQQEEAYKVFQQSVSGKPLEGLELYWMGKLMQTLGKGYNAKAFFKEAYKNKYDLSPDMVADLERE